MWFWNLKKADFFFWAKLINFQPVLKETLKTSEMQIYWNKMLQSPVSLCSCSKVSTKK